MGPGLEPAELGRYEGQHNHHGYPEYSRKHRRGWRSHPPSHRPGSQTAKGMDTLRKEMMTKGYATYGQYLRWREKKNLPIRINQEKMSDSRDGYAYYPSREMLREEFHIIWEKQEKYYPKKLTDDLKHKVEDELFFQRAITSPPPGKCPYCLDEFRLPKISRLFQIRRIFEEANNLRFHHKNGEPIEYGLTKRDKIVDRLMTGENLTSIRICYVP